VVVALRGLLCRSVFGSAKRGIVDTIENDHGKKSGNQLIHKVIL
jgi:hypothetical protein